MAVPPQAWTIRDLRASDADLLADFHCASEESPHSAEVQEWVRTAVVRWVSEVTDQAARPGGLLLVASDDGRPIAVSAFELGLPLLIDDIQVLAVRIQVLAVGDEWQGMDSGNGVRFSTIMLRATLERIRTTWPASPVAAVVAVPNGRSSALFRRAGFAVEMPHPRRPGYSLFLRPPGE